MGFGHLPQWVKHTVENFRCVHCGESFVANGIVCNRKLDTGTKTFFGEYPDAKECRHGH